MQYNVIVTAEISRSIIKPHSIDVSTSVGKLLSDIFANQIEIVSQGILKSSRDGRIILTFNGEDGQEMKISFSKKDPGLIAISKKEPLFMNSSTVFLEQGTRRRCVGKSIAGDHIEFTVVTDKVDNRLLKSGKLNLDYAVEVCGVRAENSNLILTVIHDKSEAIKENNKTE